MTLLATGDIYLKWTRTQVCLEWSTMVRYSLSVDSERTKSFLNLFVELFRLVTNGNISRSRTISARETAWPRAWCIPVAQLCYPSSSQGSEAIDNIQCLRHEPTTLPTTSFAVILSEYASFTLQRIAPFSSSR